MAVVGANGTIGQAGVKELEKRHAIVKVGHSREDAMVDITSTDSIKQMFQTIGKVDAVVSTIGSAHFAPLENLTE